MLCVFALLTPVAAFSAESKLLVEERALQDDAPRALARKTYKAYYLVFRPSYYRRDSTTCEPETSKHHLVVCENGRIPKSTKPNETGKGAATFKFQDLSQHVDNGWSGSTTLCTADTLWHSRGYFSNFAHIWTATECNPRQANVACALGNHLYCTAITTNELPGSGGAFPRELCTKKITRAECDSIIAQFKNSTTASTVCKPAGRYESPEGWKRRLFDCQLKANVACALGNHLYCKLIESHEKPGSGGAFPRELCTNIFPNRQCDILRKQTEPYKIQTTTSTLCKPLDTYWARGWKRRRFHCQTIYDIHDKPKDKGTRAFWKKGRVNKGAWREIDAGHCKRNCRNLGSFWASLQDNFECWCYTPGQHIGTDVTNWECGKTYHGCDTKDRYAGWDDWDFCNKVVEAKAWEAKRRKIGNYRLCVFQTGL